MFVVISVLIAYEVIASNEMSTSLSVALTLLSLVLVYVAARYIVPQGMSEALQYGLAFAVVGVVLDFLISAKFAPDMFSSALYWIGYALIIFVPLLAVKKMPV